MTRRTGQATRGVGLVSLAVALVACAGGSVTAPSQGANGSPGAEVSTLRVGEIMSTTGVYAPYGVSHKNGIAMAIDEVNATGGVLAGGRSHQFALEYHEDQGQPDLGATSARQLIADGVNVWLGVASTQVAQAIEPLVVDADLVFISGGVTYDGPLFQSGKALRLPNTRSVAITSTLAPMLEQVPQGARVGFLVSQASSDQRASEPFQEAIRSSGLELVETVTYNEETTTDFKSTLTRFKALDVQGIFVFGINTGPIYVASQAKQVGMSSVPIVSGSAQTVEQASEFVDPTELDGLSTVQNVDARLLSAANVEGVSGYLSTYREKFGDDDDRWSIYGHDSVYILAAAIAKADSIEPAKIAEAMFTLRTSDKYVDSLLVPFQTFEDDLLFDKTYGGAITPTAWSQWEGGQPVLRKLTPVQVP
jgi:branched-chain amino acid transport system substrate-binding protein